MVSLYLLGAVFAFSVMILCNNFYASSDLLFEQRIPFKLVALINLLDAPATIVLSLPVASLFAVMLAIGQLGRQSEITAMRCGGISLLRIMLPVLALSVFISLVTYLLDENVVPKASNKAYELKRPLKSGKMINREQDVFFRNADGVILYAGDYDMDSHFLSRVLLYETERHGYESEKQGWIRITSAYSARFEGDELIIDSGKSYLYNHNGELVGREEVKGFRRSFPIAIQKVRSGKRDAGTLAGGEIAEHIARAQEAGQDPIAFQTNLHFKYSTPVACLIFSFVGFIFSVYSPRKEAFVGMLYAIILVLLYYVMISVFKSLGIKGIIPYPVVSAWTTNVLYLIFGIIIFARTRR